MSMLTKSVFAVSLCTLALGLAACDDKTPAVTAPSATVTAAMSVPPVMSEAPVAAAAPSAAAAPASSTVILTGKDTDDVSLTVKDPAKDGEQTVKAKAGGAFTLFLPDAGGMVWAADAPGALGKPKEEVIPGFAPQTMGHQFKWTGLKAGKTTVTFGNRKAGAKGGAPASTWKLTVEVL